MEIDLKSPSFRTMRSSTKRARSPESPSPTERPMKRLLVSVNSDTSVPLLSSLPSYQAVAHAQAYTPVTPSLHHGNVNGREEQWVAQTRELTIAPNASPYAHSDDVSMSCDDEPILRSPQARSLVPAISISIDHASPHSSAMSGSPYSPYPHFDHPSRPSPPLPNPSSPFLTVNHPSAPTPPLGNTPSPVSPTGPLPPSFLRHHSPSPASPLSQAGNVQVDADQTMWEDVRMETPPVQPDGAHGRPKPKPRFSMGPRTDCEKCRLGVKGHWAHFD